MGRGRDQDQKVDERNRPAPSLGDFAPDPTRKLSDWRWLWEGDHRFPIRSHRPGLVGRLVVFFKKILRPLVQVPQNDLWDRQRVFNLILLEYVDRAEERLHDLDARVSHLEAFMTEGLNEVMRHNDALFSRVDQKLDRYRTSSQALTSQLKAALAVAATEGDRPSLVHADVDGSYLALENRHRGTREEIEGRLSRYLPLLKDRGKVLDLGCGRGEALALLGRNGVPAFGIDANQEMVRDCQAQGLEVRQADLLTALAAQPEASLGGVVLFHVIEHLEASSVDRLVRLAWRALGPGGVFIVETPSPLSVLVGASNFWLDPTHLRPVHPESLRLSYQMAGFDDVEQLDLNPFPPEKRLPEIDLAALRGGEKVLADRINRLRDHLDDMLYGCQDYALVGFKKRHESVS